MWQPTHLCQGCPPCRCASPAAPEQPQVMGAARCCRPRIPPSLPGQAPVRGHRARPVPPRAPLHVPGTPVYPAPGTRFKYFDVIKSSPRGQGLRTAARDTGSPLPPACHPGGPGSTYLAVPGAPALSPGPSGVPTVLPVTRDRAMGSPCSLPQFPLAAGNVLPQFPRSTWGAQLALEVMPWRLRSPKRAQPSARGVTAGTRSRSGARCQRGLAGDRRVPGGTGGCGEAGGMQQLLQPCPPTLPSPRTPFSRPLPPPPRFPPVILFLAILLLLLLLILTSGSPAALGA